MEMWIMNPKISRPAQDLLLSVAVNSTTHSQADVDVIGNFIKLRLKNKPNITLYLVIRDFNVPDLTQLRLRGTAMLDTPGTIQTL